MNLIDSIPRAFAISITITGSLICSSGAAYADAPPPETFNKPAELVLTLSDDLPQIENLRLSPNAGTMQNNSTDKFISDRGKNRPLQMDCGMNTNPYADTGNSVISRLSGACDVKYSY